MNTQPKPKRKLWKKITMIAVASFIFLVILVIIFWDKYAMGLAAYNQKDYEKAYRYFSEVKPDDKNYADALVKASLSKAMWDSLQLSSNAKKDKSDLAKTNEKTIIQAPEKAEVNVKPIPKGEPAKKALIIKDFTAYSGHPDTKAGWDAATCYDYGVYINLPADTSGAANEIMNYLKEKARTINETDVINMYVFTDSTVIPKSFEGKWMTHKNQKKFIARAIRINNGNFMYDNTNYDELLKYQ